MRCLAILLTLAGAIALTPPATAQREIDEDEARQRIPHYDAMKEAATRGRQMYLYDQAAWHATDSFLAEWGSRPTDGLRGYFVEPTDGERLTVVFFGEEGGKLVEVARYLVADGEVLEGGLLEEAGRPELSPLGKRLVEARQAAFGEARAQQFELCNRSPPNILMLPPDAEGKISVYIMTAPIATDAYPVGGHFRIDVGPDGKVVGSRRFLNTCYLADYGEQEVENGSERATPEALVLSHLLDPQPTEIHVFASYYIPVPLMLATTENQQLWSVRQGSIGYVGPLSEPSGERD